MIAKKSNRLNRADKRNLISALSCRVYVLEENIRKKNLAFGYESYCTIEAMCNAVAPLKMLLEKLNQKGWYGVYGEAVG